MLGLSAAACASILDFKEFRTVDSGSDAGAALMDASEAEACAPQAVCNGQCVDITTNDHCGGCSPCQTNESCQDSMCVCLTAVCSGQCVDITTNDHCGGCDPCQTNETCQDSTCVCSGGYHRCAATGMCEADTESTACGASCVTCGLAMFGTVACVDGGCVVTCTDPLTTMPCSTGANSQDCFDLTASTEHCGSCDQSCEAPQGGNGTATCSGMPPKCGVSCVAGYTPCTPDGGAASCVYTLNDVYNCGSCGHVCPADAGAGLCVNGVCK